MKEEQYITKEYFDKTLDKKFEEQSQIIVAAVDGVIEKRIKKTEEKLEKKIDDVRILIDGYVKAREEFKQEFVIVKEEMKQVKLVLKEKLGVEVRAI